MKKSLILFVLLAASFDASAATAFWTGRMELAQSVTYQQVFNCEYNYIGRIFWRAFRGTCPSTIEVY